jgi:hypothetical protein
MPDPVSATLLIRVKAILARKISLNALASLVNRQPFHPSFAGSIIKQQVRSLKRRSPNVHLLHRLSRELAPPLDRTLLSRGEDLVLTQFCA